MDVLVRRIRYLKLLFDKMHLITYLIDLHDLILEPLPVEVLFDSMCYYVIMIILFDQDID